MWTIRKPKRANLSVVPKDCVQPNYEVPRFVARQILMLLRIGQLACDELDRIFPLLPAEQQRLYAHLVNIGVRPAFLDLMKLIDLSEEHGLLSHDEAATVRTGRCIDNPVPDDGVRSTIDG